MCIFLFRSHKLFLLKRGGQMWHPCHSLWLCDRVLWQHQFLWLHSPDTEGNSSPPGLPAKTVWKHSAKCPSHCKCAYGVWALLFLLLSSTLLLSWCFWCHVSIAVPKQQGSMEQCSCLPLFSLPCSWGSYSSPPPLPILHYSSRVENVGMPLRVYIMFN